MPALNCRLAAFGVFALSFIPQPLFAQTNPLVPRSPSNNITEALPVGFPSYSMATGDTLILFGRQIKGYHVKGMPLTFKPDSTGVEGIIRTYFFVNNKVIRTDAVNTGDPLPIYEYPRTDEKDISSKHIQVVAQTEDNKRYSLTDCMLYSYPPTLVFDYTAAVNGERGELAVKDRTKFGNIYCFINEATVGKMNQEAKADCDLRHLPPGTYRFAAVAETSEGYFLPFRSYPFTIESRYRLELPQVMPESTMRVSLEKPNSTIVLRTSRSEGCSATIAHIYVDSIYLGDVTPDSPEIPIPLRDLPTGKIMIEAVPVGKDGLEYPAESIEFSIKNVGWEQRTYNTSAYTQILTNIKRITELEKEAVSWMTRAENEPNFTVSSSNNTEQGTDSRGFRYTITYLTTLRVPGRAGEYIAKARAAVMNMAQLTLENGRLYRSLKMNGAAKSTFRRAIYLAGSKTNTGSIAQGELTALLKPRR